MIGKKLIIGGIVLLFVLSLNVSSNEKNIIYVSPSQINTYLNQTFTLSIVVLPSGPSYSSGCDITFNSSILHVLNVLPGDFDIWLNLTIVDNINGSVKYIMGASNESISHNITLAKIVFKAVGVGHSYINLTGAFIGSNTSIETINASVNVSRDTEPPYSIANLNPSMPNGNNGWYVSNVSISISSIDNGTGVNKTYYSIDGGEFKEYNATITISQDGIHEIKYYSIDAIGNVESVKNITIKIDKTKPYTKAILNGTKGNKGWYRSNVSIKLNATDNISGVNYTEYKIDDEDWKIYNATIKISSEGIHKVYFYSIDNAGNVEAMKNETYRVDNAPPYSIANLNPSLPNGNNGWYVSNVSIKLNATDNISGVNYTEYKIDDEDWKIYNATIKISSEGIHKIYFYSIDNAGNVEAMKNETIKIDKTMPSLNITKYPPSITNSKNITFEWQGKDNLTPDNEIEYSYMLEGYDTSWSSWGNVKNASYYNLTDGEYIFWVKAKDKAGNINVQNKSFSINTSPPSIKNITAYPPIAKIGGYVNISCKVKGIEIKNVNISIKYPDGSIHNFSMNGKNNSYYYNSSYSGIGTYNFTISAVDSAGNIGMANGSFKIADLTPPNVKISYPRQNDVLKGSVVIRWNATDNHDSRSQLRITIKYSKDGGATWHLLADDVVNNGSYVWNTTSMEDGKDYRLQVIAYDRAGNRGADISSVFIIDNTPPTLELKKPVAGYLYIFDRQILPVIGKNAVIIGKITVEAVATDSITGVEKVAFYIDGDEKAVVKNKPYSWEWKNIAIGKHEIMVKAYDNAGNIMEKKVEALVFIL